MVGVLNQRQADFLLVQNPTMAIFHSFLKVHNGLPPPPPFRPIIAGIVSLNENLCAWLDSYLQPLIPAIPGFLKDTFQDFE